MSTQDWKDGWEEVVRNEVQSREDTNSTESSDGQGNYEKIDSATVHEGCIGEEELGGETRRGRQLDRRSSKR